MRTARHPLLVAIAAALTLVACGGGGTSTAPETDETTVDETTTESPSTATPETAAPDTALADTMAPVTEPPTTEPPVTEAPATEPPTTEAPTSADTVTLLDAGAEPRSTLRLSVAPGSYSMTIVQAQDLAQTIVGVEQPLISSVIQMEMQLDVSVIDSGFEIVSSITSATAGEGVPAAQAASVEAALAPLIGVRTLTVIDDRGLVQRAEIDDESLAGVDPATATTMTQLTESSNLAAPLPAEPVGIGARWTVEQTISTGGLEISQLVEYRLTEITGTVVQLDSRITQRPLDTTIQIAGVPGDVEITEWSGTGTGTTLLDLTTPVATSRVEVGARQVFAFAGGEIEQDLTSSAQVFPTPA